MTSSALQSQKCAHINRLKATVQHADIPPPKLAAIPQPTSDKLLLISRPNEGRRLNFERDPADIRIRMQTTLEI